MSTLTLVRHGQAAPFHQRDAALTAVGERQAAALAEYWLGRHVEFHEAYSGGLERQIRTGQVVAECYREAGRVWPVSRANAAWNEYDAHGVLQHLVPARPHLAALAAEYEASRQSPEAMRKFQRMFEAAMTCWLEGDAADGVEPWTAFRERVSAAIRELMEGPPGRRVVVFTSGGPIGLAMQHALGAPDRVFLEANWRVRNASVSEFLYDRGRFSLDSFNHISHLEDSELRTWR